MAAYPYPPSLSKKITGDNYECTLTATVSVSNYKLVINASSPKGKATCEGGSVTKEASGTLRLKIEGNKLVWDTSGISPGAATCEEEEEE